MITEREALELNDRLMGHMSTIEKYSVYARNCPDREVQQMVERHLQGMKQHFNQLNSFFNQAQQW